MLGEKVFVSKHGETIIACVFKKANQCDLPLQFKLTSFIKDKNYF